jgi:hypothetical protein
MIEDNDLSGDKNKKYQSSTTKQRCDLYAMATYKHKYFSICRQRELITSFPKEMCTANRPFHPVLYIKTISLHHMPNIQKINGNLFMDIILFRTIFKYN